MPDLLSYVIGWMVLMFTLHMLYYAGRGGGRIVLRVCEAISPWH